VIPSSLGRLSEVATTALAAMAPGVS